MNANELANLLEVDSWYKLVTREEIATMLRQQQAEIKALKLQLHTTLTNRDLRTYDGKTEMNNEPVAWMVIDVDNGKSLQFEENKFSEVNIPLYTHPVKEQLTDEEIFKEMEFLPSSIAITNEDLVLFARAILRKASEK